MASREEWINQRGHYADCGGVLFEWPVQDMSAGSDIPAVVLETTVDTQL